MMEDRRYDFGVWRVAQELQLLTTWRWTRWRRTYHCVEELTVLRFLFVVSGKGLGQTLEILQARTGVK